jgi:hypothetical protein
MVSLVFVLCSALGGEAFQTGWDAVCRAGRCGPAAQGQIDWEAYYRDQGSHINPWPGPPGGPQRINTCPVFVSPNMQWAVPNSGPGAPGFVPPSMQWAVPNGCLNGPPGPPPAPAAYAH